MNYDHAISNLLVLNLSPEKEHDLEIVLTVLLEYIDLHVLKAD